jgi:hypothetical protein
MTPIGPPPFVPQLKLPLLEHKDERSPRNKWQSRILEQWNASSGGLDGKPGMLAKIMKECRRVINPPFVGAVIGLALGLTSYGALLSALCLHHRHSHCLFEQRVDP